MQKHYFVLIVFLSILIAGCAGNEKSEKDQITVGISSDIENFNPLFSFSVNEGYISELLYLSLVKHEWNSEKSAIESYPMLASKWEWSKDSTSIVFYLRDDVNWTDGRKVTAEDVAFSFDIYSDPLVQSRLYGSFSNFYTDSSNHIIIEKTFNILTPGKIQINFRPGSKPSLFNVDLPVIPKHIFEKVDRKNISSAKELFTEVTNGAFKLKEWKKNQYIILSADPGSFLTKKETVKELVFKIIPEYASRINQLKKGEIDLLEEVKNDDVKGLSGSGDLKIESVKGREYDYVGWNNIDPEVYSRSQKFVSHKLFGNAAVRKALTHAINRNEIIDEYLGTYGQLCEVPVSPVMKNAYNQNLTGYEYNPEKARDMLKKEGWEDKDNDGIIEKNGQKFSFQLFIPGGNPRRAFAASVIKNNLKAVGIEVKVETRELSHLIDNLFAKKLDAWIVSLYIPLPLDLRSSWYSDMSIANLNFSSYRSIKADQLLNALEKPVQDAQKNNLYRQFQQVIHEDQPVTFLYWIDNIVAYNKRIKNIKVDPLGVIQKCWEWSANN